MSSPKYLWWGYVNNMLRAYPDNTNQEETAAINEAIEITGNLVDGEDRLKAVRLVFFDETHKIAGAAMKIHCSPETAQNWLRDFKYLVAKQRGLTKDCPKKP